MMWWWRNYLGFYVEKHPIVGRCGEKHWAVSETGGTGGVREVSWLGDLDHGWA